MSPGRVDEITDAVIAEVWPDREPVVWREDVRRAVELTLELNGQRTVRQSDTGHGKPRP